MTARVATIVRRLRRPLLLGLGIVGASAVLGLGGLWASNALLNGTLFYSTAAPPPDYPGPIPVRVTDAKPQSPSAALVSARSEPSASSLAPSTQAQLAASTAASIALPVPTPPRPSAVAPDLTVEARRLMAECKQRYDALRDYSCTFFKRERLSDGRLTSQHVMQMKARTRPQSVYMKFLKPNAGREAIYVAGQHGGKALVHDVGIGKLLAGTLKLDPRSSLAMVDCRHPITEAGLGYMIDEITGRWAVEMKPGETEVMIRHNAKVGDRPCTLIVSRHPQYHPDYLFHLVKVYIDQEYHLPIRFEAYDWPRTKGGEPNLVEEYTYMNLKPDVGFSPRDFDPNNPAYSFGHF